MPNRYFLAEVFRKHLVPEEDKSSFEKAFSERKKPAGSLVFGLLILAAFSFLGPLAYRLMAHLKDWGHFLAIGALFLATGFTFYLSIRNGKWKSLSTSASTLWDNSLHIITALLAQAIIAYLDLKFNFFGAGPLSNILSIAILGSWAYFSRNITVYGMAVLSIYNLIGLKVYTFAWLNLAWQPDSLVLEMGLLFALIATSLSWYSSIPFIPSALLESLRLTHIHYLAFCLGLMLEKTGFAPEYWLLSILSTVYWHLLAFKFRSLYLLVMDCLIGYLLALCLYFHYSIQILGELESRMPMLNSGLVLLITLSFLLLLFKQSRKLTQLIRQKDESGSVV